MAKHKISFEDIENRYKEKEYQQLYEKIVSEIEKGSLEPIKASGLNGRKPALYNRYWEIEEEKKTEDAREEIIYQWYPALKKEYYLKHLKKYEQDKDAIDKVNAYFTEKQQQLQIPLAMNERSFAMFQREKFITQEGGKRILSNLGLSMQELNYYETSEPLSYYSHNKQSPQNFLIIENKDTFYSMRKYMIETGNKILGLQIGTLIYGGGKAIYKSFADYADGVEPYFSDPDNQVYYFGDLDYEGILIYETLASLYPMKISVFLEAYETMLKKAELIWDDLPRSKEKQNRGIGTYFLQQFSVEYQQKMQKLLNKGMYIPQEIINVTDYNRE